LTSETPWCVAAIQGGYGVFSATSRGYVRSTLFIANGAGKRVYGTFYNRMKIILSIVKM